MGPVLFTIFINDLPESLRSICKIFADDTKIYGESTNHVSIQEDIQRLEEWSAKWDLHFNTSKCKVLHIGKGNTKQKYTKTGLDGQTEISKCQEECDLGVTFDEKLNFDSHIQKSINKANKILGIIKRTFSYLDKDIFLRLYKAMVRPHLEYANVVWSPFLKRQSSAIEKVQRRATKILHFLKEMNYEERLKVLKLPSLKSRRLRGDLILTYKILNNSVDINTNMFFTSPALNITRKSTNKIFIKYSRTNIRKFSFSNRVAPYWNELTDKAKLAPDLNNFKKELDNQNFMKNSWYCYDN